MNTLEEQIMAVQKAHSDLKNEALYLIEDKAGSQRITEVDINKIKEYLKTYDDLVNLCKRKYSDFPEYHK